MSSRTVTREFRHFLIKFEVDDCYYVCTRIKILTEGRVHMGEYYNVIWGKTDDEADIAVVLDTGDWLDMRKKMTEFEVQLNSPVSSPSPSPPESPIQLKRKRPAAKPETTKKQKSEANILCIEEGINDPYVYHPESPTSPQLSALSPLMSASPQQVESSTQTSPQDPPAFSIKKTLAVIQKQLEVSNSRQSELERLLIQQQQKIDTLLAITRQQTPAHVTSTPSSAPRTPTFSATKLK